MYSYPPAALSDTKDYASTVLICSGNSKGADDPTSIFFLPTACHILLPAPPLPLTAAKGYAAAVLICGGNSKDATILSLKGNDCPGCYIGASRSCGLIYPDSGNPQWQWENMPGPR